MKFEVTYITITDEKSKEYNLNSKQVKQINKVLSKWNLHLSLGIK